MVCFEYGTCYSEQDVFCGGIFRLMFMSYIFPLTKKDLYEKGYHFSWFSFKRKENINVPCMKDSW